MIAFQTSFNPVLSLRERLKRVQRLELYYDDLHSTSMLMRRCEISDSDIPELIDIVSEDLLDCDPSRFDELQTHPEPDGNEANWCNNYLLATPSDDWIASIVATRALIELKAEEALPLFVELLFENRRFPRLSVGIEAQRFFAPLGEIAIEPLCEAFELSGPEEDEGRRDVAAALGFIGDFKREAAAASVVLNYKLTSVKFVWQHDNQRGNHAFFLFAVSVRQEETALRVDEKFVKFTLESLMLQMKLAGNRFDCDVQLFGKLSGAGNIVGWYFESITNLSVDDCFLALSIGCLNGYAAQFANVTRANRKLGLPDPRDRNPRIPKVERTGCTETCWLFRFLQFRDNLLQ